jgi:phosphoenolpyruvate carboxykinase (ATP)
VGRGTLIPCNTWTDPVAYDEQAMKVASMFVENFEQFEDGVSDAVAAAGPQRRIFA